MTTLDMYSSSDVTDRQAGSKGQQFLHYNETN